MVKETKALDGHQPHILILREDSELLARCTLTNDLLQVGVSLTVVQKLAEFKIMSFQHRDTDTSCLFKWWCTSHDGNSIIDAQMQSWKICIRSSFERWSILARSWPGSPFVLVNGTGCMQTTSFADGPNLGCHFSGSVMALSLLVLS